MRVLGDLDAKSRRVLVRVDFNVPLADGKVADDARIRASLPTIEHLCRSGASVVLMSHLGRPKGVDPSFSTAPVAERLSELIGQPVRHVPTLPSDDATLEAVRTLGEGEIALLENVRFEKGETKNDPALAERYARLGEAFVLDAFGAAHRAHASVVGVAAKLPSYAGFLLEKEVAALARLLEGYQRPYWVVLGGAKVSDKIGVIKSLLPKVDGLVIGGAMAFTFIRALGGQVGRSLIEAEKIALAGEILEAAERLGKRILLPEDVVAASEIAPGVETEVVQAFDIPKELMGLDLGPKSQQAFAKALAPAKTVFWNGPMGVFEVPPFDAGTLAVARAVSVLEGAFTVVGGGDSVAAVRRLGLEDAFTHVSTGGGASLEFLEKGTLPGVEAVGGWR